MNTSELTPLEEQELERLSKEKKAAEDLHWKLRTEATKAIKARNAAVRELKKITRQWLALAERKYKV